MNLNYRRGHITYVVCPSCSGWAFTAERLAQHFCDRDWPRFLEHCGCSTCREYREWTAGNQ